MTSPHSASEPKKPQISLGVDVLLYPMILLILPSLGVDVDVLLYLMILLILPSLSVDVDVRLYPMMPLSLGVDVLLYLMVGHRHRIELPQVTLCPRQTGVGSEVSSRLSEGQG